MCYCGTLMALGVVTCGIWAVGRARVCVCLRPGSKGQDV